MNKYIELAKKLKALADQGIEGEKENAIDKLDRLMKTHGITLEQIEGEKMSHECIEHKANNKYLAYQCVFKVLGTNVSIWGHRYKRTAFFVECTKAEYIEIITNLEHYWELYQKESKLFFKAFILRNKIHGELNVVSGDSITAEEYEDHMRVMKMQESIKEERPQKRIDQ